MKISLALLILLLAAAWTGSQGMSFRSPRGRCCTKFYHKEISESKIQGYQYTPSNCPLRAVLVKLPQVQVCVDPRKRWLQMYLRKQMSNCTST
ncbi:C-C motif chemokine 7-like [Chamaea fasciata]|uniref:C-C motif chemokine 7-like n=1 Tax=Chamaea fasciata TaxID=190680 RepID=UPI00336A65AA